MEEKEHDFEKQQIPFVNNDSVDCQIQRQNEHINKLFNKRFLIVNNECYSLPEPTTMFKDYLWKIDELQMLKDELNSIKACLNNYDLREWHLHTNLRNSAKDVMIRLRNNIRPELLTQAWCKFYEIVASFPLIPVDYISSTSKHFTSIHLCEAPGAFITSLNHWLKTNTCDIQWDWIAMTLNPYYEGNSLSVMIDDDRFIRHTLKHWCFGEDNTGNIMNLKNLNELIKLSELHQNIFLITADGSMDCTDVPAEQESVLIHLHVCETVSALQLLAIGGTFLLKIFTTFECNSVCLIYLLSCCFHNVSIVKPATSKEGNSEAYVVCTNFKGPTFISPYIEKLKEHYEHGLKQAIFCKHDIPHAFITKMIECSEFFKSQQCQVIQNNINTFNSDVPKMLYGIRQIQHMVADKYIKDYKVKKLESGEIVGNVIMSRKRLSINAYKKSLHGSYNERCEKQYLPPLARMKSFCNDFYKIELHVLSDGFINYKFTKLPKELQIRSGKKFHTICNSKFCSKNVLKIKHGVDDLLSKINHKIEFPSIESVHELKAEILHKSNHKIVVFKYTDTYDDHKMITEIYDALQKLNNGTTLTLIGYSLLTHYSIGLLYIISCAFNSLKVTVHNDLGVKITLHHYNYNLKVLNFLNEINVASSEAQRQGKAILEIISPLILYEECNLCYSAEEFNHWIIKAYIHYALYMLEKVTN